MPIIIWVSEDGATMVVSTLKELADRMVERELAGDDPGMGIQRAFEGKRHPAEVAGLVQFLAGQGYVTTMVAPGLDMLEPRPLPEIVQFLRSLGGDAAGPAGRAN